MNHPRILRSKPVWRIRWTRDRCTFSPRSNNSGSSRLKWHNWLWHLKIKPNQGLLFVFGNFGFLGIFHFKNISWPNNSPFMSYLRNSWFRLNSEKVQKKFRKSKFQRNPTVVCIPDG
jgi:hypothetical protein